MGDVELLAAYRGNLAELFSAHKYRAGDDVEHRGRVCFVMNRLISECRVRPGPVYVVGNLSDNTAVLAYETELRPVGVIA